MNDIYEEVASILFANISNEGNAFIKECDNAAKAVVDLVKERIAQEIDTIAEETIQRVGVFSEYSNLLTEDSQGYNRGLVYGLRFAAEAIRGAK